MLKRESKKQFTGEKLKHEISEEHKIHLMNVHVLVASTVASIMLYCLYSSNMCRMFHIKEDVQEENYCKKLRKKVVQSVLCLFYMIWLLSSDSNTASFASFLSCSPREWVNKPVKDSALPCQLESMGPAKDKNHAHQLEPFDYTATFLIDHHIWKEMYVLHIRETVQV